jgi:hypothetical protein
MYGTDTTAGGALALTGSAMVAQQVMLGVILLLAGAALLTTGRVLRHRSLRAGSA